MFKPLITSKFILLSTLIFFGAWAQASNSAASVNPSGWSELSLTHDHSTRYFRVYLPANLRQNPDVVFVLHGGTQSMRKIFKKRAGGTQEWQALADDNGFLLIAPNASNAKNTDTKGDKQNWNDCRLPVKGNGSASQADDVGFINALIDWSHQHFQANLNRVYATGASNGGMMTLRLMTELGNRLAAAAVFIANQPAQTDCSSPNYAVPLMIMNGTDDPLILWQGGQIRKKGVTLLSSKETLKFWLNVNKLSANKKTINIPDINSHDDSYIVKNEYQAKSSESADLWFYTVNGGGHTTPSIKHKVPMLVKWLVGNQNKDIEASREAWNFMQRYTFKPKIAQETP